MVWEIFTVIGETVDMAGNLSNSHKLYRTLMAYYSEVDKTADKARNIR